MPIWAGADKKKAPYARGVRGFAAFCAGMTQPALTRAAMWESASST